MIKNSSWEKQVIDGEQISKKLSTENACFLMFETIKGQPVFFWWPKKLVKQLASAPTHYELNIPVYDVDKGDYSKFIPSVYNKETKRFVVMGEEDAFNAEELVTMFKWQSPNYLKAEYAYREEEERKLVRGEHPSIKEKIEASLRDECESFAPDEEDDVLDHF